MGTFVAPPCHSFSFTKSVLNAIALAVDCQNQVGVHWYQDFLAQLLLNGPQTVCPPASGLTNGPRGGPWSSRDAFTLQERAIFEALGVQRFDEALFDSLEMALEIWSIDSVCLHVCPLTRCHDASDVREAGTRGTDELLVQFLAKIWQYPANQPLSD